jgi:hypothetical protein
VSAAAAPAFVTSRIAATRRPRAVPPPTEGPLPPKADASLERGSQAKLAIILAVVELAVALTGLGDRSLTSIAVLLFGLGLLIAAAVQPRLALYGVVGIAIFFEPYNRDPLMAAGTYFNQDIQGIYGLPGVQFTLLEVIELFTLIMVLAGSSSRGLKVRGGRLFAPAMLFFGMLVFGMVRGQLGSGLFNYAVWEVRFVLSMIVCYVIAANVIRTRKDVREFLSVFFVIAAMFGIEAVYRRSVFIEAGLLGEAQEFWYAHEDVIFWAGLMLLVVTQQVFGAPRWQRLLGPPLALLTGYALLVSERRAGMISVIIAFMVLSFIFMVVKRKAFFLLCGPLILCGAIYLPLFWNATGPMAQPARAIRSINDPDPRDAQSNMSRVLELINIRATIASDPFAGIGFGRPYLLVVPIPDISFFQLWQYETHHNILWIWLKTGMAGFILFWCLLGSGLSRAASYVRRMKEPELRTFALLAVIGIVSSIVYCYVDLGFGGSRVPIFLGTLLGGISVLDQMQASRPTSTSTSAGSA